MLKYVGLRFIKCIALCTSMEEPLLADAECRVCRCGSDVGVLYYPCRCKGSIGYVHEGCLVEWLKISNKSGCEVCKSEFRFQQIYKVNTPTHLGNFEMLYGSIELFLGTSPIFMKYAMVCLIWLFLLPYVVQRIHLLMYSTSIAQFMIILFESTQHVSHPGKEY